MLECVPNVSEGRDPEVLRSLVAASAGSLLDLHHDADHHRAVLTLAGPGPLDARAAARSVARVVVDLVDMARHEGVHPHIGTLDVVPFVALSGTDRGVAVDEARAFGAWAASELGVPVFFYGDADSLARSLPALRAAVFTTRLPDLGPRVPHPKAGAIAVGARPVLVAVNCNLDRDDLGLARAIAAAVRERDGGLPGVRALGLRLASRGVCQVSMNLVDLRATGVQTACEEVRARAHDAGADIAEVELVGLVPAAELARCDPGFLAWSGITPDQTIEHRLASPPPRLGVSSA